MAFTVSLRTSSSAILSFFGFMSRNYLNHRVWILLFNQVGGINYEFLSGIIHSPRFDLNKINAQY